MKNSGITFREYLRHLARKYLLYIQNSKLVISQLFVQSQDFLIYVHNFKRHYLYTSWLFVRSLKNILFITINTRYSQSANSDVCIEFTLLCTKKLVHILEYFQMYHWFLKLFFYFWCFLNSFCLSMKLSNNINASLFLIREFVFHFLIWCANF